MARVPGPVAAAKGRPRDASIDESVLATTVRHLARFGYEAMSVAAVADEAGTTRQAVYRRWPAKGDLATAAIASLSRADERIPTEDPFADLVRELESFQAGVSRPNGIQMVGLMLLGSTDPGLVRLYRERIVAPRRVRLLEILRRAVASGQLPAGADLDLATNALVGSWYARELAGAEPSADWAARSARLIWDGLASSRPVADTGRPA
jgi:AcrR family transcriptional regulator